MALTRRSLLTSSVLAGSGIVLSSSSLSFLAQEQVVGAASAADLPVLTNVLDPQASEVLKAEFPTFSKLNDFYAWAPFTYVLTGPSTADTLAFTSRWELTINNAPHSPLTLMHYFRPQSQKNPALRWGTTGNKTRYSGRMAVLKKGKSRLFSPFFAFSADGFRKFGEARLATLRRSNNRDRFPLVYQDFLASRGATNAHIDSALYMDGRTSGSDSDVLLKTLSITRAGEHDEAWAIYGLIRSQATPQTIREELLHHASGLAFSGEPTKDLYYRVRCRQAKVLLRRLDRASWSQFLRTVDVLRGLPKWQTNQA